VAGRIRQEDIEAVRERTDLPKVVGQYLSLRKGGNDRLVGLCPFHAEKTASFGVSPSKGLYYCHGCGEGGDAVKFLQRLENLSFVEAVERLAREAGIALRYEAESPGERQAASRRQSLHRANAEAGQLYQRMLVEGREGEEARAYLASRGIGPEAIEEFGIGYAPGYADFLLRRLAPRFSPDVLVEAGLALKDAAGSVRDRFRGRITFPIHDLSAQAVGFGARLLGQAEGQPKYLNSPDTPVYHKGRTLYNLHRARGAVARGGEAVVVEGYTDVIALARGGIGTAVATCGTALGEEHFQLLSRFAQRVVLAFDSDEAGARAAERAYTFHEKFPLQVRVLVLPQGLDPADYVRERGGEAFATEVSERSVALVEYMLERTVRGRELASVEGHAGAVRAALPIVAGLADAVRRQEYAHLLADLVGVSVSSVLLELERAGPPDGSPGGSPRAPASAAAPGDAQRGNGKASPQQRTEWEMLKLLVQSSDVYERFADRVCDEHFERAQHRRLLALLREAGGEVRGLVGSVDDEQLGGRLAALATEPVEGDVTIEHAGGVWLSLDDYRLKRMIDAMRKRLERLNPVTDPEEYGRLFAELVKLEGERRRLREQGPDAA
jgi:DNA primase